MALERTTAFYPVCRVEVQARTIGGGVMTDKFENMIKGPLPKRIVLGMVESAAYNGQLNKNPFNFQSFRVKEIPLTGSRYRTSLFNLTRVLTARAMFKRIIVCLRIMLQIIKMVTI